MSMKVCVRAFEDMSGSYKRKGQWTDKGRMGGLPYAQVKKSHTAKQKRMENTGENEGWMHPPRDARHFLT